VSVSVPFHHKNFKKVDGDLQTYHSSFVSLHLW
jgi:hypothetical protein